VRLIRSPAPKGAGGGCIDPIVMMARQRALSTQNASGTVQWRSGASRSPGERSDTRDREDALREDPHIAHAHAGYDLVLCELICASCKHNLRQQPATNQPDGQIT
jgi:hypothetical protein